MLALFSLLACQRSFEFVVPHDFEGPVVVIFDDPNGVESAGTLRIPRGGVLYVNGPIRPSTFGVYAERPGGERARVSCTKAEAGDPRCLNFLVVGGTLNGCLPESAPPFNLVTFVIATQSTRALENVQERVVREATLKSLEHRGLTDVSNCYRDRPHALDSYLKVLSQ